MPRLKWLIFQMPMSSPHRIRMFGFFVAMSHSFHVEQWPNFPAGDRGRITVPSHCMSMHPRTYFDRTCPRHNLARPSKSLQTTSQSFHIDRSREPQPCPAEDTTGNASALTPWPSVARQRASTCHPLPDLPGPASKDGPHFSRETVLTWSIRRSQHFRHDGHEQQYSLERDMMSAMTRGERGRVNMRC